VSKYSEDLSCKKSSPFRQGSKEIFFRNKEINCKLDFTRKVGSLFGAERFETSNG